jgi:TRAP-type C4-dicarboxylate transport system substrate-binding protein
MIEAVVYEVAKQDVRKYVLLAVLAIAVTVVLVGTKKWNAISMENRITMLEQRIEKLERNGMAR